MILTFPGTASLGARALHVPPKLNEVDFHVRHIGLGSSQMSVVRKFGKPLSQHQEKVTDETCGPAHTDLTLTYEGIVFRLEGDIRGRRFEVVAIEVTSPDLLIAPLIQIGMNDKQTRMRLGAPVDERDEAGLHMLLYVTKGNNGGASLYFDQGKLVKVHWEYTLC